MTPAELEPVATKQARCPRCGARPGRSCRDTHPRHQGKVLTHPHRQRLSEMRAIFRERRGDPDFSPGCGDKKGTDAGYQRHQGKHGGVRTLPCEACSRAHSRLTLKSRNRLACAPGLGWPLALDLPS